MSSVVTAPGAAQPPAEVKSRGRRLGVSGDVLLGTGVAGALLLLAFLTTGGTNLAPNTWTQIALLLIAAGGAAALVVLGAARRPWGGAMTLLLFAGLVALTFASIAWSVQPANSWLEANRTLSYFAAFLAAAAFARLAPARWPALAGGVAAFATVVCAWALLVKVFPATLDATDQLGRVRVPFDYYNATGLAAAIGLPGCLWAGARREGGPVLRALSMPATAILLVALFLSQSRGALLAAVVGIGLWLALVSVRLRAVLVLAVGALGSGTVLLWALRQEALTHDYSSLAARTAAGHTLGLWLVVMLVLVTAAGIVMALAMERVDVPAHVRRRFAVALLGALGLIPVLAVVALAASSRGLAGQFSHAWNSLTNPNSVVFNAPGRLAQLGSSRPRYWSEGLKVGEHAPLAGTGALGFATARTRYSTSAMPVQHAHSYAIETFADFGVVGVVISVALLVAWLRAATRIPSGPGGQSRSDYTAERGGLHALLAVAVIFGVSSLIDWTWFIPGVAVPAIVCAGWLTGCGRLSERTGLAATRPRLLDAPARVAALLGIVAVAALAGWIVWQPLRSANAFAAATNAPTAQAAIADARTAAAANPVSVEPLWELSALYTGLGDLASAHRELTDATSLQPENPLTWQQLAQFDLQHHRTAEATAALRTARQLDPSSAEVMRLRAQLAGAR